MSGWFPKTSRLGILPNYTRKPRKLALLGTMLKKVTERSTGKITCDGVVQNLEQ